MSTSKTLASMISLGILITILWPVQENWKEKPRDSFPMSYFPMFSHKRDSIVKLHYFVGYDTLGQRHYLPFRFVGSGGFNQVRRQINKKVNKGKGESLCETVAKRLSNCRESPYNQFVKVNLVSGSYNLNTHFSGSEKAPLYEHVIASKTSKKL